MSAPVEEVTTDVMGSKDQKVLVWKVLLNGSQAANLQSDPRFVSTNRYNLRKYLNSKNVLKVKSKPKDFSMKTAWHF